MKILVNAISTLSPLSGVGTYAYNVSRKLLEMDGGNDYLFFYQTFFSNSPLEGIRKKRLVSPGRIRSALGGFSGLKSFARAAAWQCQRLAFLGRSFDIYFEPGFIPLALNSKKVVTTVHDFSFMLHPGWHPRDRVEHFRRYFKKRIKVSDFITVPSEFIRRQAGELLDFDHSRIKTVHPGYDPEIFHCYGADALRSFRKKRGLPENYILYAGSIEPRKNIEGILKAWRRLPEDIRKETRLAVTGVSGWRNTRIMELMRELKDDIVLLGYLDGRELALAYAAARLLVYPSFYEGFGIPPLEAMACGCPAVVSDAASLPEVCGDAAFYVDPDEIESIAGGILRVLTDETLRLSLAARGLERAKSFGWDKTAAGILEIFSILEGNITGAFP